MVFRDCIIFYLSFLLLPTSCLGPAASQTPRLTHVAAGPSPEVIALYEAWFGHPQHISVGYSSQDPATLTSQIRHAQSMGISGFVVDWYGDREPFIDKSYALMQQAAAKNHFHVAMMYDETSNEDDSTDEAIADFTMFHETYLSAKAPGHQAYLTYEGRPVIFIFPKGGHTDWNKVRALASQWNPAPLLIQENLPGSDAAAFDGFYAWINPGAKGWTQDGSNWGSEYLSDFYQTMKSKYPDRIIVGGAWASFNDSKAGWGLNRRISARCGQTFTDTFNFWRKEFPQDQPIPFIMMETWNDYEEGTAMERGVPDCGSGNQPSPLNSAAAPAALPPQGKQAFK
jgi:hypothetical protein